MPTLVVEAGIASRIMSHREIMISLAGLCLVLLTLLLGRVNSAVLLLTPTKESWSFPDMEASFAPRVPTAGIVGVLQASDPVDACEPLRNVTTPREQLASFLLIERGLCSFEVKVRHAQEAGFEAVIVYNNLDDRELVTMSGDSFNINTYAVFVSRFSGQFLLKYAGDKDALCYIMPAFENTAWSVMAVSFISLLAVSSVLATFFFVRQHRLRHMSARFLPTRDAAAVEAGMSVKEVDALPRVVFQTIEDEKGTSETCAICLEDYIAGDLLRLLPCQHEFHLDCIDQWLTTRRPFCPVCKRDASCQVAVPPSESTPLLAAVAVRGLSPGGIIRIATPVPSPASARLLAASSPASARLLAASSPASARLLAASSPSNLSPDTRIFSLSYPDHGEDLC